MTGAELIAEERARQLTMWPESHDDEHKDFELADAAESYLAWGRTTSPSDISAMDFVRTVWPWDLGQFHPSTNPIENLVKAGALIAAEIDKRQRAQA